jgi:hypothetical protein
MSAVIWSIPLSLIVLLFVGSTERQDAVAAANLAAPSDLPHSPLIADRHLPGLSGTTEARLAADGSARLATVLLSGRTYSSGGDFPTFVVLTAEGQRVRVSPADPRWVVERRAKGSVLTVTYAAQELEVEVAYHSRKGVVDVRVEVLREGQWKLVAVEGTLLRTEVDGSDESTYIVDGAGWLVFPSVPERTVRRWDGNSDNTSGGATTAAFVAWREADRIVFVKPLTFSHSLGWSVVPGKIAQLALSASLYFRPQETKLLATRRSHDRLALRLETAGDVNGNSKIDWVDAGIAYRTRYVKRHEDTCARRRLREAVRAYYSVHAYKSYTSALAPLLGLDFAEGIWWSKGMMEPAVASDWESHKFDVRVNPALGQVGPWKRALRRQGQWVGPYYGHDYVVLDGAWPEEFIKRDPENRPFRYAAGSAKAVPKYYKDNVRPLASGAMQAHYKRIIEVCELERGDPIMLDTFSAFARPSYHPDAPTTAELETQAKHRLAEFLHDEQGLIVAGEGLVEGLQTVVDYGAIALKAEWAVRERIWEMRNGVRRVPMLPVVFLGASYYGAGWFELRNPNPNWAVGLIYGVGYWDWLPEGPEYAWMRFARYYFNQGLIWGQIADTTVRDVEQRGADFRIRYDNGAVLEANVDTNTWALTVRGTRYDGFTPFNSRGYMAVLVQGEFWFRIPGRHQLVISPHQPFRDRIQFECVPGDNETLIRGQFGHLKWRLRHLQTEGGREVVSSREAAPVLVLVKAE